MRSLRPLVLALALSLGVSLSGCSTPSVPRDCTFAQVLRVGPQDHLSPSLERDLLELNKNVQSQCHR